MISYRITKYNPLKRNRQGHYLDKNEWTSISDIGKEEYNNLKYDDYEKIESAYVKAVQLILKEKRLESLEVASLELNATEKDFEKFKESGRLRNIETDFNEEIDVLKNGHSLSGKQLWKVIRLILRETMWMQLVNPKIEMKFGYDYYMYVQCEKLEPDTIEKIECDDLFVEPQIDQITYNFIDEKGKPLI